MKLKHGLYITHSSSACFDEQLYQQFITAVVAFFHPKRRFCENSVSFLCNKRQEQSYFVVSCLLIVCRRLCQFVIAAGMFVTSPIRLFLVCHVHYLTY